MHCRGVDDACVAKCNRDFPAGRDCLVFFRESQAYPVADGSGRDRVTGGSGCSVDPESGGGPFFSDP